jgi:hypothetical protein
VEHRIEYGVVEQIDLFRPGQSAHRDSARSSVASRVAWWGTRSVAEAATPRRPSLARWVGRSSGNKIERANERDRYRVTVLLDNGPRLELTEFGEGELRVGDRVRVEDKRVYRE